MKFLRKVRQYLGAQPVRYLWLSTLVFLTCFFGMWYTWSYRALVCATNNLEERLLVCTKVCDKDTQAKATFKELEEQYKATVKLLQDYKGDRDAQTFYHHAVDQLLKAVHVAHCLFVSFSSDVDDSQSFYKKYQATLVCNGSHGSVVQLLDQIRKMHSPWRVMTVTLNAGHHGAEHQDASHQDASHQDASHQDVSRDTVYHLTLVLECLVLA